MTITLLLMLVVVFFGLRQWTQSRLDTVEDDALACLDRIRLSGEGDPRACVDVTLRSELMSIFPRLAEHARQLEVDLDYRAAVQALQLATVAQPDANARRIAASEVIEIALGVRPPTTPEYCPDRRALPAPSPAECRDSLTLVGDAGAWSVLLATQPEILSGRHWRAVLDAATATADLDAIRELVDPTLFDRVAYSSLIDRSSNELAAGVWHCLLGDPSIGLSFLTASDEHFIQLDRTAHLDIRGKARLAHELCSGSSAGNEPNDGIDSSVLPSADLLEALTLARLEMFDDAHEAATRAQRDTDPDSSVTATWLRMAMAIRTGRATDHIAGLPEPPAELTLAETSLEQLAWLWHALLQPPDERRRMRLQTFSPREPDSPVTVRHPPLALPAILYLAGSLVDPPVDAEVWLDAITGVLVPEGGRAVLSARAEAARWRGDPRSAEIWASRAHTLHGMIHDTRTSRLAQMVGF